MSCIPVANTEEVCANCGKGGSDTVKLKNCTACRLVKYCGVDCQKIHRKQHKKACKERAAELKDEKLYGQGQERAEGGFCPICLLAIPFPTDEHSSFRPCCSKLVCNGCIIAANRGGLGESCPFCRSPMAKKVEETLDMVMKRAAARDPIAICHLGDIYHSGVYGLEKDEPRAFELWSEAADLGSSRALTKVGVKCYHGDGVTQDKAKGIRCWESAAMRGCVNSRHYLGRVEHSNKKYDRAVRHFLISAKMGFKDSLDKIKEMFTNGLATKAQYVEGLKGYQDAVEEMKNPQRDEAMRLPKPYAHNKMRGNRGARAHHNRQSRRR